MDVNDVTGELPRWRPGAGLTPLEEQMLAAAAAGDIVDLGEGSFTMAEMQAWQPERTVRALVLRHLLVADEWPTDAKGVRLRGVRITGQLDVEGAALRCPLYLDGCYLDASRPVCFDFATASGLTLTGCRLAGLTAEMLVARDLEGYSGGRSVMRSLFPLRRAA